METFTPSPFPTQYARAENNLSPECIYFKDSFIPKADMARRAWVATAKVCQLAYQGLSHVFVDTDGVNVQIDPSLTGPGIINAPLIPNAVDSATATVASEEFIYEPIQLSQSEDDMLAAQAAGMVMQRFDLDNPIYENNLALIRQMLISGMGFQKLYTQESFVPVVMKPDVLPVYLKMLTEEQRRKGNANYQPQVKGDQVIKLPDGRIRIPILQPVTKQANVSPFGALVETGADSLNSASEFCFHEVRPIEWLISFAADTGFDFSQIQPMAIVDTQVASLYGNVSGQRQIAGFGQQTGETFGAAAGLVRTFDCWKCLSPTVYYHSFMVQGANGYFKIFEEQTDFHPYISYGYRHLTNYFWDQGLVRNAMDSSRAFLWNLTKLQENFQTSMKDIILCDPTLKVSLNNTFANVIPVNPRSQKGVWRLDMPAGAYQQLQGLVDRYESITFQQLGVSDLARGVVRSHVADKTVQSSQDIVDGPLGLIRSSIQMRQSMELYPKVLRFARQWDVPRYMIPSGGAEKAMTVGRAVRNKDLGDCYEVKISRSVRMPETVGERMDLGIQLVQAGLFSGQNPDAIEQFKDFVQMGKGIIPENTTDDLEQSRARAENEWMIEGRCAPAASTTMSRSPQGPGGPPPPPPPILYVAPDDMQLYMQPLVRVTDNHQIHMDEIDRAIRENKFDPNVIQVVMMHRNEHQMALQQAQQQQQAMQIEMMAREASAQSTGQVDTTKAAGQMAILNTITKAQVEPPPASPAKKK